MTFAQAYDVLDKVGAQYTGSRQDHIAIQEALGVMRVTQANLVTMQARVEAAEQANREAAEEEDAREAMPTLAYEVIEAERPE